ncbi:putative Gp53 [uncultured Mycobacterium sp.]|uniref:Putative Gp53 n=1 Tax=uncultured Mycobacterium sp. TaxID=171292 RepID=A0A1Y5P532_9MYCO|nr:putative Gp53 [uncultured Mycobacterium sp.]
MTEPADPTELAGVAEMHTEAAHAWSLDADEDYPLTGSWQDPERRWTPRRVTVLAVVTSVIAVCIVGGFGAWKLRTRGPDVLTTHVFVATETVSVTTVVAVPAPRSTANTAAPKGSPRMPPLAIFDKALINNLRQRGWTIRDEPDMISKGHLVCDTLRGGASPSEVVARIRNGNPTSPPSDAQSFLSTVMLTYPDCP